MGVADLSEANASSMRQRARVFIPPQTPDSFLSVYMAGSLSIVELDRWATLLWHHFGIVFFGSNDNSVASNENQKDRGSAALTSR